MYKIREEKKMDFQSERTVVNFLVDSVVRGGVSLFNAVKYIYSLAEDDFYNCNIKDALKIVLNNITDNDCLKAYGLKINREKCREMESPVYNKVLPLIVYSFAVRLPVLKNIKCDGKTLSDQQIKDIYDAVIAKGAENYKGAIPESFEQIKKTVKQNKSVPPYTADWYKTFIYTYVSELSEIKNKNIYLLGAVDILFTMFETCLFEKLEEIINDAQKI